jgi:hypothetical protein
MNIIKTIAPVTLLGVLVGSVMGRAQQAPLGAQAGPVPIGTR